MAFELSSNTPLVEPVLLNTPSVGYTRCIEDAKLRKMLRILTTFTNASTYHYIILALEFVQAGRVGPTLVARTTLLVGMIEVVEVVVINIVPGEDIGDKFQK